MKGAPYKVDSLCISVSQLTGSKFNLGLVFIIMCSFPNMLCDICKSSRMWWSSTVYKVGKFAVFVLKSFIGRVNHLVYGLYINLFISKLICSRCFCCLKDSVEQISRTFASWNNMLRLCQCLIL